MESLEPVKLLMESYLLYIVFNIKEMIFLFKSIRDLYKAIWKKREDSTNIYIHW